MSVRRRGTYTRKRGLDRETKKMLLLRHIQDNREDGSPLRELRQVLPEHSERQVQRLLGSLKSDGRIYLIGVTSAARWYPVG